MGPRRDLTLIIDGNNMAHRAHYAYNLSFRGHDVSAIYGTVRMIQALIRQFKPQAVIICWDGGIPNYRKRLIPAYKGTRKRDQDPSRQDFVWQLQELQRIVPYFGILQVRRIGLEADDLMYQASIMLCDTHPIIVTSDEDLLQALSPTVSVYKPGKQNTLIEYEDHQMDFVGEEFVEWKALQGDSSDNIKGVMGVGPKTATKILDGISISERLQAKVDEYYASGAFDNAYDCIDLSCDRSGARYAILDAVHRPFDRVETIQWCIQYGFTSLMETHSLGMTFGKLKEPKFDIDGLGIPRVWDYKRYPYE